MAPLSAAESQRHFRAQAKSCYPALMPEYPEWAIRTAERKDQSVIMIKTKSDIGDQLYRKEPRKIMGWRSY